MLTFTLRKNQARVRYRLWLAASVKFLIPFSLLISLGGHLARPRNPGSRAERIVFSRGRAQSAFYPDCRSRRCAGCTRSACCLSASSVAGRSHRGLVVRFCRGGSVYGGDAGGDSRWRCAAQCPYRKDVRWMRCGAWSDCRSANADQALVFTGFSRTGHLWHRSASSGLAGWNFSAPCAVPTSRRSLLTRYGTCAVATI